MLKKIAEEKAKTIYGEHAFAEIPKGQWPRIGVAAGDQQIIFGVGITFEEAFDVSEQTADARRQANLLYAHQGFAGRTEDGRCEVGVMLHGKPRKLGSAGTFAEAFKRANLTSAAKHADEILDTVEAVERRFGSAGSIDVSISGNCIVRRGEELMGLGTSFKMALENAIKKDNAALDQSRRRMNVSRKPEVKKPRDNKRPRNSKPKVEQPLVVAVPEDAVASMELVATGPLELNHPAVPDVVEVHHEQNN